VGSPKTCNDNNVCTADSCTAGSGQCSNVAIAGPCNDGNNCTVNDQCAAGTCKPGAAKTCDDFNACTVDVCNAPSGACSYTNAATGTPCDDGNKCTLADTCDGGTCKPGAAQNCTDDNPCNLDACNKSTGLCERPPNYGNNGASCGTSPLGVAKKCWNGTCLQPWADLVTAGSRFSGAIAHADKRFRTWGLGGSGQLGTGGTTNASTPQEVSLKVGGNSHEAGDQHGCGVVQVPGSNGGTTSSAYCWGANDKGQLGDGTTTGAFSPVLVKFDADGSAKGEAPQPIGTTQYTPIAVDLGAGFSCAIVDVATSFSVETQVRCWGTNESLQLGVPASWTVKGYSATPVQVQNVTAAFQLTAGGGHACARSFDRVRCWGKNNHGQLGTGTATQQPQLASKIATTDMCWGISAGQNFTCGIFGASRLVRCVGLNGNGQLGADPATVASSAAPIAVKNTSGNVLTNVRYVSAGSAHACAAYKYLGVDNNPKWRMACWGKNGDGQLGNGKTSDHYVAQVVKTGSGSEFADLVYPAAGHDHTCALHGNGSVWCWGRGGAGELGNGGTASSSVPVQVSGSNPL
jgi:alpha-tubulin suppressor-like RCC1 family protein